jgi:hypothetical protein
MHGHIQNHHHPLIHPPIHITIFSLSVQVQQAWRLGAVSGPTQIPEPGRTPHYPVTFTPGHLPVTAAAVTLEVTVTITVTVARHAAALPPHHLCSRGGPRVFRGCVALPGGAAESQSHTEQ